MAAARPQGSDRAFEPAVRDADPPSPSAPRRRRGGLRRIGHWRCGTVGSAGPMARIGPRGAGDGTGAAADLRPAGIAGTRRAGSDETGPPRRTALVSRRPGQRSIGARAGVRPGVDAVTAGSLR